MNSCISARIQTHALIRVEAFDRLHQADVAFLDQVGQLQPVAVVATGHVHHETQMRHDQLLGRRQIRLFEEITRQRLLLLGGQYRNAMDRGNIGIQTADKIRQRKVGGHQGLRHGWNLLDGRIF
jgi:hypothetical protein